MASIHDQFNEMKNKKVAVFLANSTALPTIVGTVYSVGSDFVTLRQYHPDEGGSSTEWYVPFSAIIAFKAS